LQFQGAQNTPEIGYGLITTKDFADVYPEDQRCSLGIKEGMTYLLDLKTGSPTDWKATSDIFNTCEVIDGASKIQNMYDHFWNGF